jgi:O-antigen/teichoic acid export membrane protein
MSAPVSRTARSARNVGVSVLSQVLVIALGFVTRSVFIAHLGVALVGVNSVLTSVLAMLTLADLGVNGAVMYALYGPLRDEDTRRAAAIVLYARAMFRWVALIVGVLGLALTPFLQQLVRLDEDVPQLEIYYLVLLANTVAGYLMLNRLVLLNADQKIYITKAYSMVFNTVRSVAQILSLLWLESFLVYLLIQVACTVANNLVVYLKAGRIYPYLKQHGPSLGVVQRKAIRESVRALMIFRVGGLVLQNSVPVFISVIVGTVALGYYSNYLLIVSSAVMITETVFSSLTPSVGNLLAGGDRETGRKLFDEIVLLSVVLHGAIAVAILVLVDDFVTLWIGPQFVLQPEVVVAIVVNFYVMGSLMPMWSFRSATGLFRKTQWVVLTTAAVSIALSFILGPLYGLAGVVVAPALARVVTGGWYEPWLLLRDYLAGSPLKFFALQGGAFLLWAVLGAGILALRSFSPWGPLGSMMAAAGILLVLLPAATWLAFGRTAAYRGLVGRVRKLISAGRATTSSAKTAGGPQ